MNKAITGGVVIALVLSGLAFFSSPSDTVTERVIERVGAQVGPDHDDLQNFKGGFTVGNAGYAFSTTSDVAAVTLTATEIDCDQPYVTWLANLDATLTTQASTSLPFVNMSVGQSCSVLLYSSTSTAATTLTFAAGTGVDIQETEGADLIVNGLEMARLTFVKKADTDILFLVEPMQAGD